MVRLKKREMSGVGKLQGRNKPSIQLLAAGTVKRNRNEKKMC